MVRKAEQEKELAEKKKAAAEAAALKKAAADKAAAERKEAADKAAAERKAAAGEFSRFFFFSLGGRERSSRRDLEKNSLSPLLSRIPAFILNKQRRPLGSRPPPPRRPPSNGRSLNAPRPRGARSTRRRARPTPRQR